MTVEIFDCQQNSAEWLRVRMGIPTASSFATVMAKGEGKTRRAYLYKLAGEIITDEPAEDFQSAAMERGKVNEDEARKHFVLMTDIELIRVGFVKNGKMGWSPDSLIGNDGALEIKNNAPHVLIERLLKGECPPEHKAQLQGGLLVGEREWTELYCYWRKMPPLRLLITRDELYLKNLKGEIDRFNDELDEIVTRIRLLGDAA